jgi:hypothetical protein
MWRKQEVIYLSGRGIVLRDHLGAVLLVAYMAFANYSEAYESELFGLKQGLTLALQTTDEPLHAATSIGS